MVHSCSQILNSTQKCIESRCFNVHHGWMCSQDGTTMCPGFGVVGVLEAANCADSIQLWCAFVTHFDSEENLP